MVRKNLRGVSLMTALLLITIVMVVAATMAGVFTMNMNITQRVSNGSIALSEAEAGIAEVLYQITREENIEGDKNAENPKINWGINGETIRATITPGMNEDEAFHLVTFDPSSNFPHSTNNTYLDRDIGSMGRTIPDGMIHIVSTGYCKGQYRTVECLVEKPPFPFGLATSGPLVSLDPIKVKGVSSLASFDPDEEGDRPGHLLCNSPEGIKIGTADGQTTEISGFVKSSGAVVIEQPASVRGGIRSFADDSTIVDIDIKDFDIQGQPGVVTLLDSQYDQAQEMDVMYHYSGGHLQYMREVQLKQAMLYVEGDLTIHGPVYGEGLIVVDGNATFKSGTALAGTNKMAILASGDITIEGNNNYFMGLVYCEGNLDASNITIVGNTVVNSADASKGKATLENVTVVSNEETGDMTIEITSSSEAQASTNLGNGSTPNVFVGSGGFGHVDGEGNEGWIGGNVSDDDLSWIAGNQLMEGLLAPAFTEGGTIPEMVYPPGGVGNAGHIWQAAEELRQLGVDAKAEWARIDQEIDDLQALLDDDDPNNDAGVQGEINGLSQEKDSYKTDMEAEFQAKALDMLEQMRQWAAANTDASGTLGSSISNMDIIKNQRFNLNEYHPESEKIKMAFWRVYPRRM